MNTKDNSTDLSSQISDCIYKLSDTSYSMEMDRYSSLLSSSGRLISCVSILSLGLVGLFPLVKDNTSIPLHLIFMVFGLTGLMLLISLAFALAAQYRFKYKNLQNPNVLAEHIIDSQNEFKSEEEIAKYYAESLNESANSIYKRNETLSVLIRISTISLGIALIILAFGLLVHLILCGSGVHLA